MSIDPHVDRSLSGALPKTSRRITLADLDNPVLLDGLALWQGLKAGRPYPSRNDISARALKTLLRNTELVRVIDGGLDYEYRIVGDAYVLAHGTSFQGKRWSEFKSLSPVNYMRIKPVYDEIVELGEPIATRGWIERSAGMGQVYAEYLLLPLGETDVDHILVFASYTGRDGYEQSSYFGA